MTGRAFAVAVLFAAFASSAFGQSAEESAAQAAERAGKLGEALAQYGRALEGHAGRAASGKVNYYDPEYQRVGEAAMRVARQMSPRPALPDVARNHMIRGRAAFRIAKSPEDLAEARKEFFAAVSAAPWFAEAYFNLALALEKSDRHADAIINYRIYLSSEPPEKDAAMVKDKIVELQYLQERAQKQQAAKSALVGDLSGVWQTGHNRYEVTTNGDSISIVKTAVWSFAPDNRWIPVDGEPPRYGPSLRERFEGRVQGSSITGMMEVDYRPTYRNGQVFTRPMTGRIDPSGKRIHVDFVSVGPSRARGSVVESWREGPQTLTLERR